MPILWRMARKPAAGHGTQRRWQWPPIAGAAGAGLARQISDLAGCLAGDRRLLDLPGIEARPRRGVLSPWWFRVQTRSAGATKAWQPAQLGSFLRGSLCTGALRVRFLSGLRSLRPF